MKNFIPLLLYGAIIIIAGAFLLFPNYVAFPILKFILGIGLTMAAFLSFLTAFSRKKKQVQLLYHEIHAIAMLVYGVAIIFFCNTVEDLEQFTAYLLMFYAFSEVIFCFWIFNLRQGVNYKIVFVRLFLGFLTGIGTCVLMYYNDSDMTLVLQGYGVLFIIIGTNVMLYSPIMKQYQAGTNLVEEI